TVWETATGKQVTTVRGNAWPVFLPDSRHLLAPTPEGQLILWDVITGKEVRRFPKHPASYGWLSVSADGSQAVSTDTGQTLVLWDVATGKPVTELQPDHLGGFLSQLSPDGKRIVTVGRKDRTVRLWDATTRKAIRSWESKDGAVYGPIHFLPDGHRFLTAADGTGEIARWDEKEGSPTWLWNLAGKGANGVSPD